MIWQEMKKLITIKKLLLLTGFFILYFLMFIRPYVQMNKGSYYQETDIVQGIMEQYGTHIFPEEFERLKAERPEYALGRLDRYIAADPDFAAYDIHTYREFAEKSGGMEISMEEEDLLWMKIYSEFSMDEVAEEMSLQIMYDVWDYYMDTYETETEGADSTIHYNNLTPKQKQRISQRNKLEVYSILPPNVLQNNFEVLRFFVVFLILSIIFMVMPYMVSENRSRMSLLQYSFRKGRSYYIRRVAAVLGMVLLLTAAQAGLYLVTAKLNRVMEFWNCDISGYSSGFISWFPLTLGQFTVLTWVLAALFGIGIALIVFVITGYLNNYVNAIAWQLPLVIGGCVFGGFLMYAFAEITKATYLVPAVAVTVFAAGILTAAVQGIVEKRKDMFS